MPFSFQVYHEKEKGDTGIKNTLYHFFDICRITGVKARLLKNLRSPKGDQ